MLTPLTAERAERKRLDDYITYDIML
jgi:hypothetical protein